MTTDITSMVITKVKLGNTQYTTVSFFLELGYSSTVEN